MHESVKKNVLYTVTANGISLCISALVTFVLPKSLSVEGYGYFQLFLFYTSYVGLLHFGWVDGIFLRYGGAYYDKLDKPLFSGQLRLFALAEFLIGSAVVCGGLLAVADPDKKNIVIFTGIAVMLILPRAFIQYILQATNRITDFVGFSLTEKGVYLVLVLLFVLLPGVTYQRIVVASLLGTLSSVLLGLCLCKDMVQAKPVPFRQTLQETWANISVGMKLMLANIASTFIIGLVRLAVEQKWDVATFGKISLTMSVSNLLMVFIRAVAMVMFPLLRRTEENKLSGIYAKLRTCLMIPLLGMMVLYYPARIVLSAWLPQYADSLRYMALLFPMCIYESKMSMLVETYMKTLRKEKTLMAVNLITLALSAALTGITIFWLHNLDLAVASIVFLLAFRCALAELLLSRVMDIHVIRDIAMELVLTIIFIFASWFVGGLAGLLIYLCAYGVYLLLKRKDVAFLIAKLVGSLKKKSSRA